MAKLSIIIPTYNRSELLQQQVRRILPQLNSDVELILIDNKSDYDVFSLFSETELERFKIIVNNINIGGAANIAKCFEICETDWLWTLSDDDLIASDAVETVLSHLEEKDNTVMVNYYDGGGFISSGLDEFAEMTKYKSVYVNLFWMSCCIYNMRIIRDYIHIYYRAISTMQPGIVLLVRILEKNPSYSVEVIQTNIVDKPGDAISWNRELFLFATLYVLDLLNNLSKRLNKSLFDAIYFMSLDNVRCARSSGTSFMGSLKMYRVIVSRFGLFNIIRYHLTTTLRHIVRLAMYTFNIRK